jgi:cytochrome b561
MPPSYINSAPADFDPVIKFLHWLSLLLIVVIFVLAFSIDLVPSTAKQLVLQLHRSFGVTIWGVTLGRLVWRQFTRFPNWPATMSRPMQFTTSASEYALYILLLSQPVLGLIQTSAHGDRVNLFFLGNLPAVAGPDRLLGKQLHELHGIVGYLLLGLIGLHAASGLYHHFWRRDHTLAAMLPRRMSFVSKPEQRVTG